ncbi:FAD-dependent monooxygenase [Streptomyces sp. NPDC046915]|uniref:FAD-dependent monooxygenase n=1 Tax=Streptomyces sp. NPDC046915 TaxID=3155257 RepID=UPI0033C65403
MCWASRSTTSASTSAGSTSTPSSSARCPLPPRTVEFRMQPERPYMWMPVGRTRHRIEIRLHEHEDATEMERPEVAWEWLSQTWGLGPDDVEIIRQVVYPFLTRIARSWRVGRTFLAGDAAHTMPPYTGKGACAAMRDAKNLAWKLDLVLRGLADDELLDTYQQEREAHNNQLLRVSIELCDVVNLTDPRAAHARDLAMRGRPPAPDIFPGPKTGFLHHDAGGRVTGVLGDASPQGVIRRGGVTGRFDDVAGGGGFSVVAAFDPAAVLCGEQLAHLARIGVTIGSLDPASPHHIEDADGTYREFFTANGVSAFVARPDFLLYGLARDEDDLRELIGEILQRLKAPTPVQDPGRASFAHRKPRFPLDESGVFEERAATR